MAKNETVEVSAELLRSMQASIDRLQQAERARQEERDNPRARILDAAYEAWKVEAARPAVERTQDAADKLYGKDGRRFRVSLDSTTEEGKPGPKVSEHPTVLISANSPEEAEKRWEKLCGVRRHDYSVRVEPVATPAN